jgi:hypothetical protein
MILEKKFVKKVSDFPKPLVPSNAGVPAFDPQVIDHTFRKMLAQAEDLCVEAGGSPA